MGVRAPALQGRHRRGAGDVAIADTSAVGAPDAPYRGIQPFRYEDHRIFFARDEETRLLAGLVVVYRGVLLYGSSGNGKSSLVNAGLLPQVHDLGFHPVRVRVQPVAGAELVVDEIAITDDGGDPAPFLFAAEGEASARIVLSIPEFERRLRALDDELRPLIIFDQFEEILTLFADGDGPATRRELTAMITGLLRGSLPVKLLFAFREDYLGAVTQLLYEHPELVDQTLRLGPPSAVDLAKIIRGPFDAFPGRFAPELTPALAKRLSTELAQRFGSGDVSLSEVQTVCLRLWRSGEPEALLDAQGIQGLLEDELDEALGALGPTLRPAAVALLSQMVTDAGTRNVISAEDLRLRVAEAEPDIPPGLLDEALGRLEGEAKLIRRERRRDIDLYEITSEFLVPWISARREEARLAKQRRADDLRREKERARDRRRLQIFGSIAAAMLVVVVVVAIFAVRASQARDEAESRTIDANALALAGSSSEPLATRPDIALAMAFEGYRLRPRPEAASAVRHAVLAARSSGLRGVLAGDGGFLNDIAFSPDGKTIAVASVRANGSAAVLLWNADTRTRIGSLDAQRGANAVAISPDGRLLASGGNDGKVRLWNLATRAPLASRSGAISEINALAFSPDGRRIAAAGFDGVSLGSVTGSAKLVALRGTEDVAAPDVGFSPDGRFIAAGTENGFVLWNAKEPDRAGRAVHEPLQVNGVAFSPDSRRLAVAGEDGDISVWRPAARTRVGEYFTGHRKAAADVAFSPDGKLVASAGADGTVRVWDPADGTPVARRTGHIDDVSRVAFSPDGKLLASAGNVDSTVRLWNPATATRRTVLQPDEGNLIAVRYSSDGRTLAAVGDARTSQWDATTLNRRRPLARGDETINEIAFKPDGEVVASAHISDGTIRLWNIATGRLVGTLDGGANPLDTVAYSRDGTTVAAGGTAGTVLLWRPPARKPIGRLRFGRPITAVAFSPDGRTLAVAGEREAATIYDVATRKQRGSLSGHTNYLTDIAFTADGRTVATASHDRTVRLWNASTRKQAGLLVGHTDAVAGLDFSPDGRMLASAGFDRTVRLWDRSTGASLGRLEGHTKAVGDVSFSPDGESIATASDDGSVRIWREILWADLRALRATVCDALLTGITRADWKQYAGAIPYRRSCP